MLELLQREMRLFGVPSPRIAVAGLNPHAGDQGVLGSEDENIIRPAVESARSKNIQVVGPLPGDVVFHSPVASPF